MNFGNVKVLKKTSLIICLNIFKWYKINFEFTYLVLLNFLYLFNEAFDIEMINYKLRKFERYLSNAKIL